MYTHTRCVYVPHQRLPSPTHILPCHLAEHWPQPALAFSAVPAPLGSHQHLPGFLLPFGQFSLMVRASSRQRGFPANTCSWEYMPRPRIRTSYPPPPDTLYFYKGVLTPLRPQFFPSCFLIGSCPSGNQSPSILTGPQGECPPMRNLFTVSTKIQKIECHFLPLLFSQWYFLAFIFGTVVVASIGNTMQRPICNSSDDTYFHFGYPGSQYMGEGQIFQSFTHPNLKVNKFHIGSWFWFWFSLLDV